MNKIEQKVLELILNSDVLSEDMIIDELGIDEETLELAFQGLEDKGYLRTDNQYFENTCDVCQKDGTCESPQYHPDKKVKKIRVLTLKAMEEFKN